MCIRDSTKTVSTTKYDAGSMVLVNLSLKKDELTNYATYGNDAKASIVGVADSKTGALTEMCIRDSSTATGPALIVKKTNSAYPAS